MKQTRKDICSRMNANKRLNFLMILLARSDKPHRRRSLRPVDFLLPAVLAQVAIFVYGSFLPPERALLHVSIGNFIIAGPAMLPSL